MRARGIRRGCRAPGVSCKIGQAPSRENMKIHIENRPGRIDGTEANPTTRGSAFIRHRMALSGATALSNWDFSREVWITETFTCHGGDGLFSESVGRRVKQRTTSVAGGTSQGKCGTAAGSRPCRVECRWRAAGRVMFRGHSARCGVWPKPLLHQIFPCGRSRWKFPSADLLINFALHQSQEKQLDEASLQGSISKTRSYRRDLADGPHGCSLCGIRT